ncbi:MAG TPA: hypothetical protein PKD78_03615 [Saprospiraceae bacterium]|nr:hypothetical protein [Saprospiraceae bacterium]HNG90813.1 hypothetical protein [Saprospiraceae bacterium]
MKHLLALLWFCNAQAQNFPLEPSLPEKLAQICAPLNKAQVPTGYLYNLAVPLLEPLAYRGSIADFNAVGTRRKRLGAHMRQGQVFNKKTQHGHTRPCCVLYP